MKKSILCISAFNLFTLTAFTHAQNNDLKKEDVRKSDILEKLDTNGDGTLSGTEKQSAKEAWKAEILEKYDTDRDGKLSQKEKTSIRKDKGDLSRAITDHEANEQELFKKFDFDGDGKLSDKEKASMEMVSYQKQNSR